MQEKNYKLNVNGKFDHSLNEEDLKYFDIVKGGHGELHVLKNGKSYQAKIEYTDEKKKSVVLRIGQEEFQVTLSDAYDKLVEKLGLSLQVFHQVNEIKAPMPGLVLSIEVVEGQEVVTGDPLLVLEAMKMENVIKSPGEGIIKRLLTETGKPVEKGEILIEMG